MDKKEFIKIVHASILGDGFFYKVSQDNAKANTHFMLKQSAIHKDYVEWVAGVLEDLTRVRIDTQVAYTDSRGYSCQEQLILKTMRHPTYKKMYNRLYDHVGETHIKRLDPHYLKGFDWQSAAILYMDDGWLDVKENKTKEDYVRSCLATHAFSYFENKILRDLFAEKFNVHGDVSKHKMRSGKICYYLTFKKDNAKRLMEGVSPFIFPSYEYKLYSDQRDCPLNQG